MTPPRARDVRAPVWTAGVFVALVVAAALARHGGIPAFRHDWQWPSYGESVRAMLARKLAGWSWEGLGEPNLALQVHPFWALAALLSLALPPAAVLACALALSLGAAAAGATLVAIEVQRARPGVAACAGVLYALAPAVDVKAVAGHLAYLVAYAAIPWVARFSALRAPGAALGLFLALAWCGLQIQLLYVGIVIAFVYRAGTVRTTLAACAAAVLTTAAFVWGIVRPDAGALVTQLTTSIPWERNLSSPWPQALAGIGYFTGYWETTARETGLLAPLLPWAYPAAIAGLALVARTRATARLAALYAFGFLLVAGLDGPIAQPLEALFREGAVFTAMRELYHFAVFITFAGALAAAALLSRAPSVVGAALALVLATVAVAPWLAGRVFDQTEALADGPALHAALAAANAASPGSRVAFVPAANPEGTRPGEPGGAEPLAYAFGTLRPFWVYLPHGSDAALLWRLADPATSAATARLLGVGTVVVRPGFREREPGASLAWPVAPGFEAGLGRGAPSGAAAPPARTLAGASARAAATPGGEAYAVAIAAGGSPLALVPERLPQGGAALTRRTVAERGADPLRSLAPVADAWFLSAELAKGFETGAFTFARTAPLAIGCAPGERAATVAVLGDGALGGVAVHAARWARARVSCGASTARAAAGRYVAVADPGEIARGAELDRLVRAAPGAASLAASGGDELDAVAPAACARCALVLATRYDADWRLDDGSRGGLAPRPYGGLAVWDVTLRAGERVRLRYGPATGIGAAIAVSVLAWVLGVTGFALAPRRRVGLVTPAAAAADRAA